MDRGHPPSGRLALALLLVGCALIILAMVVLGWVLGQASGLRYGTKSQVLELGERTGNRQGLWKSQPQQRNNPLPDMGKLRHVIPVARDWQLIDVIEVWMPISRRYTPEKPPSEQCNFGCDYSFVIPVGVGIQSGSLAIWTNTPGNVHPADADWTAGPVQVLDRMIYANLSGGIAGTDYQLRWTAVDTSGNIWPRTMLVLCAETS
jgi:hypothetical protein